MLRILVARSLALVTLAFGHSGFAQQGAPNGEWPAYGGDLGHSKYSPLDQINADNVQRLQTAWTWTSVDEEVRNANQVIRERGSFRSYAYEMTPLMVNGVLYATTSLGQIAATAGGGRCGDCRLCHDRGYRYERSATGTRTRLRCAHR